MHAGRQMCVPVPQETMCFTVSQWGHIENKNEEDERETERGSSTEKETLCRQWVGDETQLHVGDTTHTYTHKQDERQTQLFLVNR